MSKSLAAIALVLLLAGAVLAQSNYTNTATSISWNSITGTVPVARLGTGTPDNTTFLRGDGTWAVPPTEGGSPSWGAITGTMSAQTDLQAALDGKEPAGVAFSELSGAATDAQVPDTISIASLTQVATRAISDTTGTLGVARGGTNLTASADDNVPLGNGTTWVSAAVPSCSNPTTSKLLYDTATNTFSCGTDQAAAGGTTTLASTTLQSDAVIATYTAITGLSFTPAANTAHTIECRIIYTSTAATTGINFAWDTPASPAGIWMSGHTKTVATGANEGFSQNTDNVGTNTSAAVITTQNLAVLSTLFRNGANATTMSLGFTPETANSVSVLAGSICQYSTF